MSTPDLFADTPAPEVDWYPDWLAPADADRLMFLDYAAVSEKVGRRVIITDGDFAGVEGVVKRIKKNRHVVVELDGLTAVAIAFVPPAFLRFIDE